MSESFFKQKKVTAGFAAASLVFGFLFLFINNGITGNAVLNDKYSLNLLSLVGLLLIFCSAILAAYSLRK